MANKVKIKQRVINAGVIVKDEGLTRWGNIKGEIADQTDLSEILSGKADSASTYNRWEIDEFISYLATKKELDNYITADELEAKHYLTEHQDISHLAEKKDLQNYQEKGDYITSDELEEKGYLTEHQDITHLAEKKDLQNYQPKGNYLTEIPDTYITSDELEEKGYIQDISHLATKSELSGYQEKGNYITSDELGELMISTQAINADNLYNELYE